MQNEYRTSLEIYDSFRDRYERFLSDRLPEHIPPEEEYLIFLLDVRKHWPLMFAVDQRASLRTMTRVVRNLVNIYYRWPNERQNIQLSKGQASQLLEDALNDSAHENRPWYDIKELEGMANAVDRYTLNTQ